MEIPVQRRYKTMKEHKAQQTVSVKGWVVVIHILGFAGHRVSAAATQLIAGGEQPQLLLDR